MLSRSRHGSLQMISHTCTFLVTRALLSVGWGGDLWLPLLFPGNGLYLGGGLGVSQLGHVCSFGESECLQAEITNTRLG